MSNGIISGPIGQVIDAVNWTFLLLIVTRPNVLILAFPVAYIP